MSVCKRLNKNLPVGHSSLPIRVRNSVLAWYSKREFARLHRSREITGEGKHAMPPPMTLGQLWAMSDAEILEIPCLGRGGLAEIRWLQRMPRTTWRAA